MASVLKAWLFNSKKLFYIRARLHATKLVIEGLVEAKRIDWKKTEINVNLVAQSRDKCSFTFNCWQKTNLNCTHTHTHTLSTHVGNFDQQIKGRQWWLFTRWRTSTQYRIGNFHNEICLDSYKIYLPLNWYNTGFKTIIFDKNDVYSSSDSIEMTAIYSLIW